MTQFPISLVPGFVWIAFIQFLFYLVNWISKSADRPLRILFRLNSMFSLKSSGKNVETQFSSTGEDLKWKWNLSSSCLNWKCRKGRKNFHHREVGKIKWSTYEIIYLFSESFVFFLASNFSIKFSRFSRINFHSIQRNISRNHFRYFSRFLFRLRAQHNAMQLLSASLTTHNCFTKTKTSIKLQNEKIYTKL